MTDLLVNIDVEDLERGLRFYEEGLGLLELRGRGYGELDGKEW